MRCSIIKAEFEQDTVANIREELFYFLCGRQEKCPINSLHIFLIIIIARFFIIFFCVCVSLCYQFKYSDKQVPRRNTRNLLGVKFMKHKEGAGVHRESFYA